VIRHGNTLLNSRADASKIPTQSRKLSALRQFCKRLIERHNAHEIDPFAAGLGDVDAIEKLVAERKLTSEGMDPHAVSEIREQMERAQARRLQPHFISAFFREAFTMLGGRIAEREKGRFEISRVPSILKERDRLIGRSDPVLDRYARITFEKNLIPGQPQAELVAPGHPARSDG
jgi:hypothetical protein